MIRMLVAAALAAAVLAAPAEAKRVRAFTSLEKFARADAVVVGKVTAIEKEPVLAAVAPGAKVQSSYRVAVVKVESGLVGAGDVTHLKIGFEPTAANADAPPPRRGLWPVSLADGTEGLFFLTRHHTGDFYMISGMLPPVLASAPDYKDQIAAAKKAAAVLADPMKALKAEKGDDRTYAANVLVLKYRAYPMNGGEVDTVKLPAEESRLILKAIAEANWKAAPDPAGEVNMLATLLQLGLGEADGWKNPQARPGDDLHDKNKEAFVAWLAGPGKDYRVNRLVPKKSGK